ncbi:MAG: MBL fold metallo-hydrolase [bacterium]|nr:MBL fold metallo-hydrolase [bacterium]
MIISTSSFLSLLRFKSIFLSKNRKYLISATILLIVSLIFFAYGAFREYDDGNLKVVYLDIGQGDATYIESPNHTSVLIDGGPENKLLRQMTGSVPFYKKDIDIIILTNPDTDHLSGFIELCERYHIGLFFEPGTLASSTAYKSLKKCLLEKKVPIILARRGMKIDLGKELGLEFLFPDRDVSSLKKNDGSIVARLRYGNTEFYFMGDAPKKIERFLINLGDIGTSTMMRVLKAGHHGSNTSTDKSFVSLLRPNFAIISAGLNNRYHHPHKETLDTLNSQNITILKTFEEGNISFYSNSQTIWSTK